MFSLCCAGGEAPTEAVVGMMMAIEQYISNHHAEVEAYERALRRSVLLPLSQPRRPTHAYSHAIECHSAVCSSMRTVPGRRRSAGGCSSRRASCCTVWPSARMPSAPRFRSARSPTAEGCPRSWVDGRARRRLLACCDRRYCRRCCRLTRSRLAARVGSNQILPPFWRVPCLRTTNRGHRSRLRAAVIAVSFLGAATGWRRADEVAHVAIQLDHGADFVVV